MSAGTKRFGLLGSAVVGIGVVVFASAAFACTNLAALNLSTSSGPAGSQVTVTGSAFARTPKNTPVDLHWNGVNGPILTTVTPDAAGAINPTTITIPAGVQAGFYTIVATQTEIATGLNPWGTPTRAGFTVEGPGVAPSQAQPDLSAGTTTQSGPSGGFIALSVALGIGGIGLFGLGAATFLGSYRRGSATPSRVRSS